MAQMVEHLPSMRKALGSVSSTRGKIIVKAGTQEQDS
jgi:hypothetical protein